ncbi:hypothetical protein ACFPIJ_36725 [Dactylosporangium cerinum]|uniref:Uncharacterized protein n=1 Tax=Dactylosporangium cerinum TaxID=1434730 RepID=A0ABV9W8D4_9ACTN
MGSTDFDPDPLLVYGDALAELVPGERALAAVVTKPSIGVDPPLPPDEGPHEYTAGSVAAGVVGAVLSPSLPGAMFPWWLLFGRSAAGTPASTAAASRRACTGSATVLLVVTDTTLRLFEPRDSAHFIFEPGKDYGPAAQRLRPLWETPLPTVRSARVGWYRLHPCRLTIEFTDGSWTAFASLFEMGRRKARTAVRALS